MRATRPAPAGFPKALSPWRWRLAAPLCGLLVWLAGCGPAQALGTAAVEGRSPAAADVSGPALVLGHLLPAGAADAAGASANAATAATAAGAAGPASSHGRLGWRLLALGVGGAAGWLLVRLARSAGGGRPRVGDED